MRRELSDQIFPSLKRFPLDLLEEGLDMDSPLMRSIENFVHMASDEEPEIQAEREYAVRAVVKTDVFEEFEFVVRSLGRSVLFADPRGTRSLLLSLKHFARVANAIRYRGWTAADLPIRTITSVLESVETRPSVVRVGCFGDAAVLVFPGENSADEAVRMQTILREIGSHAILLKFAHSQSIESIYEDRPTRVRELEEFERITGSFAALSNARERLEPHAELLNYYFSHYICENIESVVDYMTLIDPESALFAAPTLVSLCPSLPVSLRISLSILTGQRSRVASIPSYTLNLRVPNIPIERTIEVSMKYLTNTFYSFSGELIVLFEGNENVGYIGPRKQWISIMISHLIKENPTGIVFKFSDDSERFIVLRELEAATSVMSSTHVTHLKAVGRIIGLAIKYDVPLGVSFAPSFIKALRSTTGVLRREEFDDILKIQDPFAMRSLSMLTPEFIEANPDSVFFEGMGMMEGEAVTVETLDLFHSLTKEKLMLLNEFTPLLVLRSGIEEVLGRAALHMLTEGELAERILPPSVPLTAEQVWNGIAFRAFDLTLPAHVEVKQLLRTYLDSLDEAGLGRFLAFATGIPGKPIGDQNWLRVMLVPHMDDTYLPRAHTCFNELQLPLYTSLEALTARVEYAIVHGITIDGHAEYDTVPAQAQEAAP
jgi:E3 ubiquitin-protein ligase HUWE1